MTIFTFTSALVSIENASINLGTDTFYAHLVKTQPAISAGYVSDLNKADYTGYLPIAVANRTYASGVLKFDDITFAKNTGASQNLVGFVLCKRLGASPDNADPVILYSALRQSNISVSIPLGTNEALKIFIDQTNGVLKTELRYLFISGTFVTPYDTNGMIYQLGTRNGAQAYVNPLTGTARINKYDGQGSGNLFTSNGTSQHFDRGATESSPGFMPDQPNMMSILEFIDTRVRLFNSTLYMRWEFIVGGSVRVGFRLYGAKFLENLNAATVNNLANWTELSPAVNVGNVNLNGLQNITYSIPGINDYYRYIGFFSGTSATSNEPLIREIEFYNATLASLTSNLAP